MHVRTLGDDEERMILRRSTAGGRSVGVADAQQVGEEERRREELRLYGSVGFGREMRWSFSPRRCVDTRHGPRCLHVLVVPRAAAHCGIDCYNTPNPPSTFAQQWILHLLAVKSNIPNVVPNPTRALQRGCLRAEPGAFLAELRFPAPQKTLASNIVPLVTNPSPPDANAPDRTWPLCLSLQSPGAPDAMQSENSRQCSPGRQCQVLLRRRIPLDSVRDESSAYCTRGNKRPNQSIILALFGNDRMTS
ncbi:hypothetical protein IWZ00DRAFT_128926 [Phyllosticta capitalensis]